MNIYRRRGRDLYTAWCNGVPCNQYCKPGKKPNILFDKAFKKVHKKTLRDRQLINKWHKQYFKKL